MACELETDVNREQRRDWSSLCRAAKAGDSQALGQLCERLRPQLLRLAQRDLGHDLNPKVGASDVVQKSLLEALTGFERFAGTEEADFRAWVQRILSNNLIDAARLYRDAQKRCTARELPLHAADDQLADGPSVHTASSIVRRKESDVELMRAVAGLPDRQRRVVEWRFRDGLSHAEIGERLGITEVLARKVYSRAVGELRNRLAEPSDVIRPNRPR